MAYSYYPKEGNPMGTIFYRVVAHSLKVYSKYTIDYIYPQATSVHAKRIGMEYPMICFNFGRPEEVELIQKTQNIEWLVLLFTK